MADRRDPYVGFNFNVEVEGIVAGGFQQVTGLQAEIEFHPYREGGVNAFVHKFAGPVKHSANLVLRHGISDATALWDWYNDVMQGTVDRKNISVILRDTAGAEKLRWNFEKACPVKWTGPELRASSSEVAFETLEFVHRGFQKA